MRDIVLVLIFVASVPFMLKRPSLGIVMWIWLSVMNPHRLTYGFAHDLPLAAAAAAITFIGLAFTKDEKRLPVTPPVIFLALFMAWMCLTSLFPYFPGSGYIMWSRVMKILLMTFVALAVIRDKQQIHWVVWITTFSVAFYGVKGGIFTAMTGGSYIVWGPDGSFIQGNNEAALAFITVIPLMRYIQLQLKKPWQRHAMLAGMLLCALAAVGSHSRGALLALIAIAGILWLKSRNKGLMGVALVLVAIAGLAFVPAEWSNRMSTIQTYDEDASAMGRINAWWMAFNLAKTNPLGGGFEVWAPETFARYAPNPIDWHAAHSIYFQVLGEHGFMGLFLFLMVGVTTWMAATDAKRRVRGLEEQAWIGELMDMCKVSMVGFGVGGAFLSLAYYDVPYYVLVIIVSVRELAIRAQKATVTVASPRVSDRLRSRRDHFGVADVDADGQIEPAPIGRPAADGWRGQAGFRVAASTPGAKRS